jgi:hypothetical protein
MMDFETVSDATSIGFCLANGVMLFWSLFKLLSVATEAAPFTFPSGIRDAGWLIKQVLLRPRARK